MTPKQREKIYRFAAEGSINSLLLCCFFISENKKFPEFSLFKPKEIWFGDFWPIPEIEPRILALLFAAEMTKTEKL